jgi:hypothetical protein
MSPGNDAGRTRALTALATSAAAAAVVMVLVTVAVATQQFARRDTEAAKVTGSPSSRPSIRYPSRTPIAPKVFEGGQIVAGDTDSNAYFEVPSAGEGWTTSNLEDWIAIPDVIDGPKPRTLQPALYGHGYCEADPEGARAYVGLGVTPEFDSDDIKGWNEALLKSWRAALADGAKEDHIGAPVVQPARELTLNNGTTAWTSSLTSPWRAEKDTCDTDRVEVTLLSIDTGRKVATMTAFRYLGTGADLRPDLLQKILESIRPLPAD